MKSLFLVVALTAMVQVVFAEAEVRWVVEYEGKDVPAAPGWSVVGKPDASVADGVLVLGDAAKDGGGSFRAWWKPEEGTEIVMEATLRVIETTGVVDKPGSRTVWPWKDGAPVALKISDGRHQEGLVFYPDRVSTWTDRFYVMDAAAEFHTYRCVIRGTDMSVAVDGTVCVQGEGAFWKAAADAELREKERIMEAELDIARAENDLTEAKARNNEEAITSATQELAILKEKKKTMEAMGITEQQATEFIKKRVELEREGDKITRDAENRKQASKDKDELALLEAKAGGASPRKMKKLEKNQRLSEERERLEKQGMNPDAAKAQATRKVDAEDRISQDEERAAMGLRPRIRGAGRGKKDTRASGLNYLDGHDMGDPEFKGLEKYDAMQPDPDAAEAKQKDLSRKIQGAGRDKAKIAERDKPSDGVGGASQVIAALQRIEKAVRDTGPASNERGKPLSSVNR